MTEWEKITSSFFFGFLNFQPRCVCFIMLYEVVIPVLGRIDPPVKLHNSYHILLADLSLDHSDLVAELLKELSNHNERIEERKMALCELMKLTQEESFSIWDEHFKTILLLLLETLGDKEVNGRMCKY